MDKNKLIAWVEIPTDDFDRAVKFYKSVLKLELTPVDYGDIHQSPKVIKVDNPVQAQCSSG